MAPVLALWKYAVAAYLRSMSPRTARTSEVTSLQIPGLQDLSSMGENRLMRRETEYKLDLTFPRSNRRLCSLVDIIILFLSEIKSLAVYTELVWQCCRVAI